MKFFINSLFFSSRAEGRGRPRVHKSLLEPGTGWGRDGGGLRARALGGGTSPAQPRAAPGGKGATAVPGPSGHAHTHTRPHTCAHAHAHVHAHTHARVHTHNHTHSLTLMLTLMFMLTLTLTLKLTLTLMLTLTCSRTHAHTHAQSHTLARAHTRSCSHSCSHIITHSCSRLHLLMLTFTRVQTHAPVCLHTHVHGHTHAHAHTLAHAHTRSRSRSHSRSHSAAAGAGAGPVWERSRRDGAGLGGCPATPSATSTDPAPPPAGSAPSRAINQLLGRLRRLVPPVHTHTEHTQPSQINYKLPQALASNIQITPRSCFFLVLVLSAFCIFFFFF